MRLLPPTLAMVLLLAAGPSRADEQRSGFFLAPQAGTLGLGIEGGWRATDHLGLRVNGNILGFDHDFTVDRIGYQTHARLRSLGLLADLHPFAGSFRLTGGLRINGNRGDLSAVPSSPVTLGGRSYSPAEVGRLNGRAEFNAVAPYVGFGWGTTVFSPNVYLGVDLGVLFQGNPKVSLAANGGLASPQFQADLERERRTLEDKARDFRFYPVLAVSVGYRF